MLNSFAHFIKLFASNTNLIYITMLVKGVIMELSKNIYNLRKKNVFSQEYLAEKLNVSRQTISNWELGETSPNPEQLLLLSKTLEVSTDNLLGNDITFRDNSKKPIYLGLMLVCGSLAGIWAFTANRFNYNEIILIIIGGVAVGYGIGLVINSILKELEWKNSVPPEYDSKILKRTK